MYRFIEFLRSLIQTKTPLNTFAEISRWSLLQNLQEFAWRIPSIWREINEQTKLLLDHSSSAVRQRVSILLALSISYDVTLFDGKSTRHPSINQLMNDLCERLQQVLESDEKTSSLHCVSHQTLNIIETGIYRNDLIILLNCFL